jgi:hypothetical protein
MSDQQDKNKEIRKAKEAIADALRMLWASTGIKACGVTFKRTDLRDYKNNLVGVEFWGVNIEASK